MRHYKLFNFLLFAGMVFSIQQCKWITIERFYSAIMIIHFFLLWGLLFKRPFIKKMADAISYLFDERDISFYNKGSKIISIATIICLICLFPLMLLVDKSIINYALIAIVLLYAFTYAVLITYIIVSVKSFFYSNQPIGAESSTTNIIYRKTSKNLFIDTSRTIVNKHNSFIIDLRNDSKEDVIETKKNEKNKILLEEIFLPKQIKKYLPIFVLIDLIYLKRDPEDGDIAEKWYDLIVFLTGGNKKSIRVSYSRNREKIITKYTEILCNSLKTKGINENVNIGLYTQLSTLILKEIKLKGFRIPNERNQEFELLCVLYLSFVNDKIEFLSIPKNFDIVTHKTLCQALQNISK